LLGWLRDRKGPAPQVGLFFENIRASCARLPPRRAAQSARLVLVALRAWLGTARESRAVHLRKKRTTCAQDSLDRLTAPYRKVTSSRPWQTILLLWRRSRSSGCRWS